MHRRRWSRSRSFMGRIKGIMTSFTVVWDCIFAHLWFGKFRLNLRSRATNMQVCRPNTSSLNAEWTRQQVQMVVILMKVHSTLSSRTARSCSQYSNTRNTLEWSVWITSGLCIVTESGQKVWAITKRKNVYDWSSQVRKKFLIDTTCPVLVPRRSLAGARC